MQDIRSSRFTSSAWKPVKGNFIIMMVDTINVISFTGFSVNIFINRIFLLYILDGEQVKQESDLASADKENRADERRTLELLYCRIFLS